MKKITINVTDETHNALVALQLERLLSEGKRSTLADVTAKFLEDKLVKDKKS